MDYFYSFNQYLKNKFNDRLWKIPLSTGYPCPNRQDGKTGCSFCNGASFLPGYIKDHDSLENQIERGIESFSRRYKVNNFYGYFQENTSTYGPIDELVDMYKKVLSLDSMKGLIISTRPDYINRKIINKINELHYKYKKEMWIELGLQSVFDKTLERINRGHTYSDFKNTIKIIKENNNLKVSVHMIIGLPGENETMITNSIKKLFDENLIDGIKFRLLEIIPGTPIEHDYKKNKSDFLQFTFDSYCKLLANLLELTPEEVVIMRLVNFNSLKQFSNKEKNISKREVVQKINEELNTKNSRQGSLNKKQVILK